MFSFQIFETELEKSITSLVLFGKKKTSTIFSDMRKFFNPNNNESDQPRCYYQKQGGTISDLIYQKQKDFEFHKAKIALFSVKCTLKFRF